MNNDQSTLEQEQKPFLVTQTGIAVYDYGDHFTFVLPPTDGTSGVEWITRLEDKGFSVDGYAKSVLRSLDFKPTTGIRTEVTLLKGSLFESKERTIENIRKEETKRAWVTPNAEIACLIRENFTNKEVKAMGGSDMDFYYTRTYQGF